MASVASSGTSPLAALDAFQGGEYIATDDESWAFISPDGLAPSSNGSIDFFPSPDTGSLRSYGVVRRAGSHGGVQPSPPAPSPLFLDTESSSSQGFAPMSGISTAAADQGSFASSHGHHQQRHHAGSLSSAFGGDQSATFSDDQASLLEQLAFADHMVAFPSTAGPVDGQMTGVTVGENIYHGRHFRTNEFVLGDHTIQDLDISRFMNGAWDTMPSQALPATGIAPHATMSPHGPVSLDIPVGMRQQSDVNAAPWSPPAAMQTANGNNNNNNNNGNLIFRMEEFGPQSACTPMTPSSTSSPAACSSASPISPLVKHESDPKSTSDAAIRKVKNARIEKRRSPADSTSSIASSSSGGSASSEVALKFITISSESAAASGGKGNMFEGYDRMTQRGRKGPLADATKESALKVRRIGACFSCHARKVKCEATRPCKSCAKISLPQIICWQFTDFTTVLFPFMMREHFVKEKMAAFVAENVQDFLVDGVERPCVVELTAGRRFTTYLTITAKAFTPNKPEILAHWGQTQEPNGSVSLSCGVAVPVGLDMAAGDGGAQRADLQKRAKDFVTNLIRDPCFAEEMTAEIRSTCLPRDVLRVVCKYAARSKSEIVDKALRVYTNHYILTRHLNVTPKGLSQLMRMRLASQNHDSQTTRLLNRQFKAVLDEVHKQEMAELFNLFSKLLKPKMRKEWAPCMAAFLILTLFMEDLEVTIDVFGTSQNQIDKDRERRPSEEFKRSHMLAMNREIEHMPFRQFAYQFHQIYQTHSTDASTKPFNPLVDASLLDEQNLDPAAMEMVRSLRDMMNDYEIASELDFLSAQGSELDNDGASHPYPMDVSNIYSGRLMAKFILSFNNIQHLLDP
ncbi:hypothetical protein RB597_004981 [Gaeumannomyces tritici]